MIICLDRMVMIGVDDDGDDQIFGNDGDDYIEDMKWEQHALWW